MKKVTGIVIYKADSNQIIYYKVNRKNENIVLIDDSNNINIAYKYKSFNDLYSNVLKIAKNNHFYFDSHIEFNSKWYDIDFIDYNNPIKVSRYGFKPINENMCNSLVIYKAISNLTGKFKYILIETNSKQYCFDYGYQIYDSAINTGYFVNSDLSCKFNDIVESLKNDGYTEIKFYEFENKYL